jgi:pimeloyl-ACP methyl ester carboxylesterase
MTRLTSHFLEHQDLTTAYYDEGSGPALLLLHGYTGAKLDFHNQLGWFTDRYRVLVPDQRGHGESTNSGVDSVYRLQQLADDLHSFIETLHARSGGLQSLHLLGHSMGGMVAMRYALAHPGKLLSLLLMDTASAPLGQS